MSTRYHEPSPLLPHSPIKSSLLWFTLTAIAFVYMMGRLIHFFVTLDLATQAVLPLPPPPPPPPQTQLAPPVIHCKAVKLNPLICAPQFVIVGSSFGFARVFAEMLAKHPRIAMVDGECFFSDEVAWRRGANVYWAKFQSSNEKVAGDICPTYMDEFGTRVAGRLHAMLPATKKLMVLRDPIERFEEEARNMSMTPDQLWLRYGESEVREAEGCRRTIGFDRTCLMRLQHSRKTHVVQGLYLELAAQFEMYDAGVVLKVWERDLFEHHRETMHKVFAFLGLEEMIVEKPMRAATQRDGVYLSSMYRERLKTFYFTYPSRTFCC